MPFDPDSEWSGGREFVDVNPRIITEPNTHDLSHYFANPSVHVPIFRQLFGEEGISAAQERKAINTYKSESVVDSIDQLRLDLKEVVREPSVMSLQAALDQWAEFSNLIEAWEIV